MVEVEAADQAAVAARKVDRVVVEWVVEVALIKVVLAAAEWGVAVRRVVAADRVVARREADLAGAVEDPAAAQKVVLAAVEWAAAGPIRADLADLADPAVARRAGPVAEEWAAAAGPKGVDLADPAAARRVGPVVEEWVAAAGPVGLAVVVADPALEVVADLKVDRDLAVEEWEEAADPRAGLVAVAVEWTRAVQGVGPAVRVEAEVAGRRAVRAAVEWAVDRVRNREYMQKNGRPIGRPLSFCARAWRNGSLTSGRVAYRPRAHRTCRWPSGGNRYLHLAI